MAILLMRVLLTATSYPRADHDWQGIFILRMAEALAAHGQVDLRTWAPPGPLPPATLPTCNAGDTRFLSRLAEDGGIAHLLRNKPAKGALTGVELVWRLHRTFQRQESQVDLFHVNWLQCALGLLGIRKPVLATVLGSDLALLEKPGFAAAIRWSLRGRPAVLCPNAPWMIAPLRKQLGAECPEIVCVPFGIDDLWYEIKRRPFTEKRIWITVLRITRAKIGALFEWTRDLDHTQHEFHLFGPLQDLIEIPPWIHYHGPTTPKMLARDWFPIATGMISLSQHAEGRPQVLLEAMAAGLPIVCSRSSAHQDVVQNDATGFLVASKDEFHAALRRIHAHTTLSPTTLAARHSVRNMCGTWMDCAQRYYAIYESLADKQK